MELVYIWFGKNVDKDGKTIDEKMPFENQDICFSKEYSVSYECEKDKPVFRLTDNKITDIDLKNYKDFYKTDLNLENLSLTCFVGKNGAGKTLLLEFIKEILDIRINNKPELARLTKNRQYLIVWKDSSFPDKIIYDSSADFEISSNDTELCKSEKIYNNKGNNNVCKFTNVVFYTSNFNDIESDANSVLDNDINEKDKNVFDISLNAMVREENNIIRDNILKNSVINNNNSILDFDLYKKGELGRRILFYCNDKNKKFLDEKFKGHKLNKEYYVIEPNITNFYFYQEYLLKIKDKIMLCNESLFNFFDSLMDDLIDNQINPQNSENNKILFIFVKELLVIYLFNAFKISENRNFVNILRDYNGNALNLTSDNLTEVLDLLNKFFNDVKISDITNSLKICFSNFKTLLDNKNILVEESKIKIPLKDGNKDSINSFIKFYYSYEEIKRELGFVSFINSEFQPRFSAGESNLITLLARFFDLLKKENEDNNIIHLNYENIYKCKNMLILIDEGDMGFHPQWSKWYVFAILSYIQALIEEYKPEKSELENIHIIFTTNSPIILSDILPQDIIYLPDNDDKKNNLPISAFGSNILDLYSDSFFMQDGLIGAFAKEKIKQVIKFIKSNDKLKDKTISKEECEFIINNIGDSNIKTFLNGLFEDKIRKEGL